MTRKSWLALGLVMAVIWGRGAIAAPASPPVSLWRLDCGSIEIGDLNDYSDSFRFKGRRAKFTDSCYLVRHGQRYLLWDAGLPADLAGRSQKDGQDVLSLRMSLEQQMAQIGVSSKQIDFLAISHPHFDHIGQAAAFGDSRLLIDQRDWNAIKDRADRKKAFAPWLEKGANMDALTTYDFDVFGDGTVIILATPGHTVGHRSLLVRLGSGKTFLLSGDAAHLKESWDERLVPGFNASRSDTLASMSRIDEILKQLRATLIIQHEPSDVAKLPDFPRPAQ